MSFKGCMWTFLLVSSLLGTEVLLNAQQTTGQDTPAPADNTTVNQRDRNANEATADAQNNNRSDREITRRVRHAITSDKSLSTYGHNVKVITQDGQVTLKGPVRSNDEKRAIEAKATEIVGEGKVTSELDIKPKD